MKGQFAVFKNTASPNSEGLAAGGAFEAARFESVDFDADHAALGASDSLWPAGFEQIVGALLLGGERGEEGD